jgi:general secretion pathway protein G
MQRIRGFSLIELLVVLAVLALLAGMAMPLAEMTVQRERERELKRALWDLPPEKTWQLRAYESEPDKPRPGADVYDVTSNSSQAGLNGVPLKDW